MNRRCSECGAVLESPHPRTRTCSGTCRSKRSRRLQAARRNSEPLSDEQRELSERAQSAIPDVTHEVLREELQPIVREAITEEVLRAIQGLVGLTPAVVTAIAEDLASDDKTLRQRAYSLIAKYTIGHPALVQADDADKSRPLVVEFNLPRPGSEPETHDAEATEVKPCDLCGADKPLAAFVAGSDRCKDCFAGQQDRANALLESGDDGDPV